MAVTRELLSDLEIARSIPLEPIGAIADRLGVLEARELNAQRTVVE